MFKTLKVKILGAFLLTIIFLSIAILLSSVVLIKKLNEASIESQHKEILISAERCLSEYIMRIKSILTDTSHRRDIDTASLKKIFDMEKSIMSFTFVNKGGKETKRAIRSKGKIINVRSLSTRKGKPEFELPISGKIYVSEIFYSSRIPYITISLANIKKEVLIISSQLLDVFNKLKSLKRDRNNCIYMVNEKGKVIMHSDFEEVYVGCDFSNLSVVKRALSKGESKWAVYRNAKNEKVVTFYRPVEQPKLYIFSEIPYDNAVSNVNKLLRNIMLISTIVIFISLVFGIKIVLRITNPLEQLRKLATAVASGNFNVKVDIKTNDEIEELAKTFNSMVRSLKELEELRKDLISMIVHDMKNPLASIISGVDYVMENPQRAKEMLSIAKNSAENLLSLIQNLLDVSKMEEGLLKVDIKEVSINEFIDEQISRVFPILKRENKKISKEIDKGLRFVKFDPTLISRVFQNLLMNAIQHTTQGGEIKISVKKNEDGVEMCVSDDGIGIPKEYREKIFEKFVQVERKRARLRTGTGLGLTFCKMAVELHNGKIWVESEEKKGSAFHFFIPQ